MTSDPRQPRGISSSPRGRNGIFITIVGPDGVGKTTLRERLAVELKGSSEVLSDRGIGPLTTLRRRANLGRVRVSGSGLLARMLTLSKIIYIFMDGLLRWLFLARPWLRAGGSILTERGWWDLGVYPSRYGMLPPGRLHVWLGAIGPKPDLILILEADAEVILSRKRELPIEEIERQARLWRVIVPESQPSTIIDVSGSADDVFDQAKSAMERLSLWRFSPGP